MALFLLTLVAQRSIYVNTISNPKSVFPLNTKWVVDLGDSTYERPAYESGLVLFPARSFRNNNWYGIAADSGKAIWSQQVSGVNFNRCLTRKYLVISGVEPLRVINIDTGELIWQGDPFSASMATCNENIVFSSGVPRDSIHAYDITTGQTLWSKTSPRQSFYGLIHNPDENTIIADTSTVPEKMFIIDENEGLLISSFEKIASTPNDGFIGMKAMYVIDQDELFIGGTVQDVRTGRIIHKEEQYRTFLPPTITTDTMYLSAYFEGIVAFDRADYNAKWVYQPQPSDLLNPLAPIAILDGIGYTIFSDATLRAFDLETGEELGYWQPKANDLWWWPICSFPPLLCDKSARAGLGASDDTLFVSFGDGKLYAFGK
jgi:outer membrane protein assembly factor BamB